MTHRNIIHFHAESFDGRMLGAMGHPALRHATPNIDRLAREGAMFENTYCAHPICCPSRANLWAGQYSHHCESWNNHKGLEPGMWSLLDQLPATHTLKTLGKLDYVSGGHTLQARLTAWLGSAGIDRPGYSKDPSQCFEVAPDDNKRCHEGDWQLVDQAIAFLEAQKRQAGARKPFFLALSTGLVHAAFRTNRYWLEKIPANAVDIPPVDPTTHPCRLFQRMAKAWRYGFEDETVRQVRRIYFAMIAELDAMVGALYEAMHRLGLADDTYFVFSSDHGELALEHQDWYKMSFYEGSVRVPLLMTGPGIQANRHCRNLVSVIDLCPTFIAMAGLPGRDGLDGESLLPLAAGETSNSRDCAYACFTGTSLNTTGYMLRKGRWKYVVYVGYPSQLFDMEKDPGELHDVIGQEPEIAAQLDRELRVIVDYEQTHRDVMDYNKNAFRQWRRQAQRGLYVDASYGLRGNPSSDYWKIMDNAFTGYDEADEARVEQWLKSDNMEDATGRFVMDQPVEPTLGNDYSLIFDHYAEIPMRHGRLITDAPSLLRTRDGALLCAVPFIVNHQGNKGLPKDPAFRPLLFFRSADDGRTWERLDAAGDFCCGTLFGHGDALYFIGAGPVHRGPESGIRIIRSDDEGLTWSDPVMLFKGPFYNPAGGYVMRDGRFYWCFDTGRDTTYVVAGDLTRDLTDPSAWRVSDGLPIPRVPREITRLDSCRGKILEGNVVEVNGRLQVSWRFMLDERDTVGIGVICDFTDDGTRIDYRFRQFHPLPGAQNQFHIVHDPADGLYWMSANLPTRSQDQDPAFNARLDANERYAGPPGKERRILALFCSFDALNWLPTGYIIVWPLVRQASNYCGLLIDGDDLLVAARTSRDGAHQHDNDLTTFHRVRDFRERAAFLMEGSMTRNTTGKGCPDASSAPL